MQVIGTVKEIWRYPVKSMAGERMKSAKVSARGIYGDRGWAIRDEKAGEIRNARKLPMLLHCTRRLYARAQRRRRAAGADHAARRDDVSLRLHRGQRPPVRTARAQRFDLA